MPDFKQESNQDHNDQDHSTYLNHLGRTQAEDFAPYSARSAVSSFNLPRHYGSTLVTPVSMTSCPAITTHSDPLMNRELGIKLSPSSMSPTYGSYRPDNDCYPRDDQPMKQKDSGALHISTADPFFPPGSPFACDSPFFGHYSVSATFHSVKTSGSSPTFHHSPIMQSAGGYSSNGCYSRNQTPALSVSSYMSSSQTPTHVLPSPSNAPILLAPHPSILKPATTAYHSEARRQRPAPSNKMSRPFRENHKLDQKTFVPTSQYHCSKVQKSSQHQSSKRSTRTKPKLSREVYNKIMATAESRQLAAEERVLLDLAVSENMPWKVMREKYNTAFPAKPKEIATLQMQKMRLVEKTQDWTDVEKRALELSVQAHPGTNKGKWKAVAKDMPKFGALEKWSAEGCEKQWEVMDGKESLSRYEMAQMGDYRRQRTSSSDGSQLSVDQQSWSDGVHSVIHSPYAETPSQLVSALSTTTMDDTRGRAASDADAQMYVHRIHHQPLDYGYAQQHQSHLPNQHQSQQRQYSQSQGPYREGQMPRSNSWTSGA